MGFRIEDVFIKTNEVGRGEDQVKVLEGLRHPKALITRAKRQPQSQTEYGKKKKKKKKRRLVCKVGANSLP